MLSTRSAAMGNVTPSWPGPGGTVSEWQDER